METYRSLNERLWRFTEEEVLALLEAEKAGPKRLSIMVRLHQRFSSLRTMRERNEINRLAEKL